jgi:hypothetical protein
MPQGRRPVRPPYGFDVPPPISWRKRKEAFGADAPEPAEPPAALQYLSPARGRASGQKAHGRPPEGGDLMSSAAARVRLCRQRQAEGRIPVTVDIDEDGAD